MMITMIILVMDNYNVVFTDLRDNDEQSGEEKNDGELNYEIIFYTQRDDYMGYFGFNTINITNENGDNLNREEKKQILTNFCNNIVENINITMYFSNGTKIEHDMYSLTFEVTNFSAFRAYTEKYVPA